MASEKKPTKENPRPNADFRIEGQVQIEDRENFPAEVKLMAYTFDRAGQLLGSADIDEKYNFSIPLQLAQPAAVELVIGPAGDPEQVRQSSAYSQTFTADDWVGEGRKFRLSPSVFLPHALWWPWLPIRVCVSGHVRKIHTENGATQICPVPFVKVEIFDVDRESCWWPFFHRWWDLLLDRSVIRIPELLEERPFPPKPFPEPDPIGPVAHLGGLMNLGESISLNPQPLPPREGLPTMRSATSFAEGSFERQVEPSALIHQFSPQTAPTLTLGRVGEFASLTPSLASRFDHLTLTSVIAPWVIFPHCFYSRQLVCETTTDCDGYFRCCFPWWPFHFRHGRLRFDTRPDIIIRVTQIINGVETVIYMDPYSSTRWNKTNVHIDLFLDNEEVQCGNGCVPQPAGTTTFLTLIGLDEVYKINQTTGLFASGGLSNWAYGGSLLACGVFGMALSSGAPKRYYRLSFKKGADDFEPIKTPLSDTRVDKNTFVSEVYSLGPQPVNGVQNLYEIRNTNDYYWYNLDKLGWWNTEAIESDTGLYTLRLEVFDELGVKLTSAVVDYRDGTVPPPGPLPPMPDHCDLVIRIDNKHPTVDLQIPAAGGDCGVVPFSAIPTLAFDVNVNQPHNRLYSWSLSYVKGLTGVSTGLASASNGAGILPLPVIQSVSAAPMTAGLTGTCAFSLTLDAWPLVRNGFSAIHYEDVTKAIAIEKCS
jgi:hypothetical protein